MKEGPDIALIGSLIGDPARANMLNALLSGKALTATELASEAQVTPATASTHLAKLESGGLVSQRKSGRHRYYSLADEDVAGVLEALGCLAAKRGHLRTRTGPKEPALRKARICYDHLAGEMGVRMLDSLSARGFVAEEGEALHLTDAGRGFVETFGIPLDALAASRRPLCRSCLDWSARRSHLAGSLGAAMLDRITALGWAKRETGTRAIRFSRNGEAAFLERFAL